MEFTIFPDAGSGRSVRGDIEQKKNASVNSDVCLLLLAALHFSKTRNAASHLSMTLVEPGKKHE